MSPAGAMPPTLAGRQASVLALAAAGLVASEVAVILRLSLDDVYADVAGAMRALGARSKLEAVLVALRRRLISPPSALQAAILRVVADGVVLVGTMDTLARSLGVSVADLRSGLRELLEAERIAVHCEPRGQLSIRLERRASRALPALAPPVERRRPAPSAWIP